MGEVYLARDLRLGRKVALKMLLPEQAGRPTFLERFRREARSAAALQHPNIVTIYAVEEADGLPFLALELVEGATLEELIPPGGMPFDRMLRIAVQLADALRVAHEHGVIHRDIKPRNLMIDARGQLKVLDFGIAKRVPAEDQPTLVGGEPTEALTREGQLLGTVSYMSPEQLQGLPLDPRSDLFSAGIVLYQMATGRLPFHSSSPAEQMIKILEERIPLPGVVRAGLPRRFDEIVGRCLERDPRQRYQSARVLRDDLDALERDPVSSPGNPILPEPPSQPRPPLPRLAGAGLLAALVLLVGASGLMRRQPAVRVGPHALAVLPLENITGEQEYFVDGMTDALIASLCNVGKVRVISRQSVMRFKGSDQALPAIARQLGVDLVITGAVVRSGLQVRITTNLVQAEPEEQLWAETYNRDLRDVLALQDEVAREVAKQVRLELTDQEKERLMDARPVNPAAFDLYLQGRAQWDKRTPDGLRKAVDNFQGALSKDPRYASAHAGLADAYNLIGYFRQEPPGEAFAKARNAASKALELDPNLAEAHASLGFERLFYAWDDAGAEKELRRALELNPSYAGVHHWMWAYLSSSGRLAEAGEHLELARKLNPLSATINTAMAAQAGMLHDFDRYIELCNKVIAMEPSYSVSYEHLWVALHRKQRFDEAFKNFKQAFRADYPDAVQAAEAAYARSGYKAGLTAAAGALGGLPRETAPNLQIANIYALADDPQKAIDWLQKGVDQREAASLWLRQAPEWDDLRSDPRFQRLVDRVNRERSGRRPPG